MTEAQLQARMLARCRRMGLLVFHARDSRRSAGPGYPDLTIAGPGGVLWAELKSAGGTTSPEQDLWGWTLRQSGQQWRLWRPADWADETILAELAKLAS